MEQAVRLKKLLAGAGLPVVPPCGFAGISRNLKSDKKNRGGQIRFSLPLAIGRMDEAEGRWSRAIDPEMIEEAYLLAAGL
jgi:3-dehydroquinate synthetase